MEFVVLLCDLDEGGGIPEGERTNQDRIDDAEDGDVGSDGQSDGEDNGRREERGFAQEAEGIAGVVHGGPPGDEDVQR